jgi:hypothetical protein
VSQRRTLYLNNFDQSVAVPNAIGHGGPAGIGRSAHWGPGARS